MAPNTVIDRPSTRCATDSVPSARGPQIPLSHSCLDSPAPSVSDCGVPSKNGSSTTSVASLTSTGTSSGLCSCTLAEATSPDTQSTGRFFAAASRAMKLE